MLHRAKRNTVNAKGNRLYSIYTNMKTRCYNRNNDHFGRYGGRGIEICDEWRESYIAFRDWALTNGYRDDLTIDRIDNDGNYEPSNCRWATKEQQQANKTFGEKPVRQCDLEGNVIAEYPSIAKAEKATGIKGGISRCCLGKRKTAKGFRWEYI